MRLAVIGDVHLRFGPDDVRWLDASGCDAVLFVGDLATYSHGGGLAVARAISALRTPAIVIPGNHDGVHAAQLLAEVAENATAIELLSRGQRARVEQLREALLPAVLAGYDVHRLRAGDEVIDCVVARPHSFGGPHLAFRPYLRDAYGIATIAQSAAKLCALVDATTTERIVFLAHNGPTGLGARRSDIWGCDFRRGEGDFGDHDLRQAIEHAVRTGKKVLAVIAGHMHHRLRGGGDRVRTVRDAGILYVNAARVPRVTRAGRHRVDIHLEGESAEAHEVVEP